MSHEIQEKRLQTKIKRQKQQLHLSALMKWQMVIVAMLLCTRKANKHFCTYGEKIYALTCDRMREGRSVCGHCPLFVWHCPSGEVVGSGGM